MKSLIVSDKSADGKASSARRRGASLRVSTLGLALLLSNAPLAAAAARSVPYLPVPKGAAVILNTGSTNTVGYRVVVQRSGAAEFVNGDRRAKAFLPASLATQFFDDLAAATPFPKQVVNDCAKSASFGTSLFVWWQGSRSGDLTCGGPRKIADDAGRIAQALGLNTGLRTPLIRPITMLTNAPNRPLP